MHPPMAHSPFFLASFTWNYALGMTWLAVPLWAASKGLSGAELGVLFSLPAVLQLIINLLGGAYVDRLGGKRIMLASCVLMAAGAAAMPFAWDIGSLFAAQLILVLARATFWPANWAIAAELPGERGVQAGRLNAVSSAGQILGNGACGFVLALGGFTLTFAVLAGLAIGALLMGLGTPRGTPREAHSKGLFDNYRVLLRMPVLFYGALCAYLSALPFSLTRLARPTTSGWRGFTSSTRLKPASSWRCCFSMRSRCMSMSPSSATRQTALSVSRSDGRTSFTASFKVSRNMATMLVSSVRRSCSSDRSASVS